MAQTASNIDFRTSQSFVLGSGQSAPAAAAGTLNFQGARDLILGRPVFSAAVTPINQLNGQVNVASVQGASILASNQNLALRGLTSTLQQDESFIGVPLVQNGVAQFQFTALNAADQITGGIYCDPWGANLGPVPSPDAMGPSSLNWAYGLSQGALPGGGQVVIQGTALRPTVLGRLYLEAFDGLLPGGNGYASEGAVTVSSILINNTEQLSSATNAAVPLECFTLGSLSNMANLNQFVPMNGIVSITLNSAAGTPALNVHGHFFCNAS